MTMEETVAAKEKVKVMWPAATDPVLRATMR